MKSINEKGNKNSPAEKEIISNGMTSNKLAENKNAESENQIQRIFRQSPFTVAFMEGENFIFRMVNAKAAEVIGKTETEIVGKSVFELMPELAKNGFREILSGVLKTAKPFVGNELPATYKKNGQLITAYFDFVYEPYYDASGKITGIITSGIDVTEKVLARKKIEESEKALAEKNTELQEYLDNATIGLHWVNADGIIIWANKTEMDLLGYSLDEYIGHHIAEFHADQNVIKDILFRLGNHETLNQYESQMICKDGSLIDVIINSNVLWVEDKFIHTRCFTLNVTEKKLSENKIEESEAQLKLITDALPVLIAYIDKNRCYRFNNKAYETWFGHSSKEISGKHMMNVLGEAAYKNLKPKIDDVLMGKPVHFEMSVPYKDGGTKWVVADYIPHFGKDNEVLGYYGVVNDISTLKKAEELNFQLASIVQSTEDAIVSKTLEGIVTSWNQSAEKIFGYSEAEMIGQHIAKIIPEHRLKEEPQIIENILQGKIVTHFETQRLTKEGKLLDISLTISPIKDSGGKIIGVSKIARNITEQVEARKKIEENEIKFRQLVFSLPVAVYTCDAEGRILLYNEAAVQLWGRKPEIGKDEWCGSWKIFKTDGTPLPLEECPMAIALKEGRIVQFEILVERPDGSRKNVMPHPQPVFDSEGKITGATNTLLDITEAKIVEAKIKTRSLEFENAVKQRTKELKEKNQVLEESENKIQTIFEAAPDAVIIIDHHGIISNWNEEAENIFGWQKNEVIGKTLSEIIIPQRYREQHKNGLKKFLSTGQGKVIGKPIEIEALKKDNTEIPVELKISASSVNNSPPVFIGFVRDISQRRQAENALNNKNIELIELNSNLEKMNKELESFTYVSSHDLQEPLRKIQTFAGRIVETENQNLSDKGKDYFHRMQKASQRMQTLILDLLTFSKINSGESKFETTDLNKIVEEVKTDFKEALEEKHATIVTNELCEHAPIIPFQFRQLMHNLIGNALKFSKPQTPPHILIKSSKIKYDKPPIENLLPQKEYCHITIQDNGIGFEKHFSEKIFEVFQRLHDKEKYSGTGIGLAIVKKIVDNHKGIITATSELGKGAQFDIYIPA